METTLAILTVLGIYIGIPAVIGLAIVGGVVLAARRQKARKAVGAGQGKAKTVATEAVVVGRR